MFQKRLEDADSVLKKGEGILSGLMGMMMKVVVVGSAQDSVCVQEGVFHKERSVSGCVCVCVQIHWQEHRGVLCRWIDVWDAPSHPHIVMCVVLVLRMNREEHNVTGAWCRCTLQVCFVFLILSRSITRSS